MHPNPEISELLHALHHHSLSAIEPGLERVFALLDVLGNPERNLPPVIHIAGTNGKGSTAAYLTAICMQAGLRVHRYTSPHLVRFNERVMLGGQDIGDDILLTYLMRIQTAVSQHPVTFFEATTALVMLAFSEVPADVCILETGMGGRWDATNVLPKPLLTVITPISMDHMDFLGDNIPAIAAEKAGILKTDVPCVVAAQGEDALRVLEERGAAINSPLFIHGRDWRIEADQCIIDSECITLKPALAGGHQLMNAGAAAAAMHLVQRLKLEWCIKNEHIEAGIKTAEWPARLQLLSAEHSLAKQLPDAALWLDGGHNADAAKQLAQWLKTQPAPRAMVCGMLSNKDANDFLAALAPMVEACIAVDDFSHAPPTHPREMLAEIASEYTRAASAADVGEALAALQKMRPATVLICGSLYLAGQVLGIPLNSAGT